MTDKETYCSPVKDEDDFDKLMCWSCKKRWSDNPHLWCQLKGLEF